MCDTVHKHAESLDIYDSVYTQPSDVLRYDGSVVYFSSGFRSSMRTALIDRMRLLIVTN